MTQEFTRNISYMIHPFPCHIIFYSHVQTTQLIRLKGNNFFAVTESKIWIFKIFVKKDYKPKIWTFELFSFFF